MTAEGGERLAASAMGGGTEARKKGKESEGGRKEVYLRGELKNGSRGRGRTSA